MNTLTYIDRNIHEILVAGRSSVSVSDADCSFISERHVRGHVDTQNHMPECVRVCVPSHLLYTDYHNINFTSKEGPFGPVLPT